MRPAPRTRRLATAARPVRAASRRGGARRGFTLVEMLVSVTLVLLMMLMFAEIYGLAQGTISTQKGIAENDQKARILSEVIRKDLATRTFRSVYPFRLEPTATFALTDQQTELLGRRRGYFSISENEPNDPTDDVLQLTVEVDQPRYGGAGDRHYGKAPSFPAPKDTMRSLPTPVASPTVPREVEQNHPEYDDGVFGNGAGASDVAEVSYFLRGGNLYRSVLLVRKPYITDQPTKPTIDTAWAGVDPFEDYALFSRQYPPAPAQYPNVAAPPNATRSVWADFDYSVYRWDPSGTFTNYEWRFHGPESLSNDPQDNPSAAFRAAGGNALLIPQSLGAPYLRFGAEYSVLGRPFEGDGSGFFGRFTAAERAGSTFTYPGNGWAPFDGTLPGDGNGDGFYDFTSPGTPLARRGVDLMLSNVHGFDVQVWDDVVGDFVDLGHERQGPNPYVVDGGGNHPVQDGFYHRSRRRLAFPTANLASGKHPFDFDDPNITEDFGNRYDTWHPQMYVENAAGGRRTGRAPYRPQFTNPDPNDANYNDRTSGMYGREGVMEFGMDRLNNDSDGDGTTFADGDPGDSDAEAPLRAVRIVVRYLDTNSGQMRQTTIETSLID